MELAISVWSNMLRTYWKARFSENEELERPRDSGKLLIINHN